ncbi:MAG: ATP-binding protein [Oscillospiraceae bacterium]|nr:ATP-binding protein [Oscillospiraceae bacterium]
MSFDARILAEAFEQKAAERSLRETELDRMRARVFREIPVLAKNEIRMRQTAAEAALAALSGGAGAEARISALREENLALQSAEAKLLSGHGYPPDALHEKPGCRLCSDTGYDGAKVCGCVREIYARLQTRELDKKLRFSEHCFEKFDLNEYSPVVDRRRKTSPRENMENIYLFCREYAETFSDASGNLAFFGGTGLGKTFLSACIVREVSRKGFYVVYSGAADMFSLLETEKFSRNAQAGSESRRFADCDLLVLDDLGTEMVTQFTVSALYNIINSRIMDKKKTIISSNLSLDELRKSYSPQIMSRIEGEFRNFFFFGEDVRVKRGKARE